MDTNKLTITELRAKLSSIEHQIKDVQNCMKRHDFSGDHDKTMDLQSSLDLLLKEEKELHNQIIEDVD
jgi:hypothetical protein